MLRRHLPIVLLCLALALIGSPSAVARSKAVSEPPGEPTALTGGDVTGGGEPLEPVDFVPPQGKRFSLPKTGAANGTPAESAPAPAKIRIGGYVPASQRRAVGFINKNGQLTLPAKSYLDIANFSQGLAAVLSLPANATAGTPPKYGYIRPDGSWAVTPQFDMAGDFKPVDTGNPKEARVLAKAQLAGRWGFINPAGDWVIPARYDSVQDFSEGLAAFEEDERFGYLDADGRVVIPSGFLSADGFQDGLARVWDGTERASEVPQLSFINRSGQTVFQSRFDWVSNFSEGLARVGNLPVTMHDQEAGAPDAYGFIDTQGNLVIPVAYEAAWDFSDGLALVKHNGEYGFINNKGKWAINRRFAWADSFHEGMAAVQVEGKYGFIDKRGRLWIPAAYDWVGAFSDGLAPVAVKTPDGKTRYGFVAQTGKLGVDTVYDWVKPFSGGYAQVMVNRQ